MKNQKLYGKITNDLTCGFLYCLNVNKIISIGFWDINYLIIQILHLMSGVGYYILLIYLYNLRMLDTNKWKKPYYFKRSDFFGDSLAMWYLFFISL